MIAATAMQWWFGLTFAIAGLAFAFWWTIPGSYSDRGDLTRRGFCAVVLAACAFSMIVLVMVAGLEAAKASAVAHKEVK